MCSIICLRVCVSLSQTHSGLFGLGTYVTHTLSYSYLNPKHISQGLVLSGYSVSLCGMNEWMDGFISWVSCSWPSSLSSLPSPTPAYDPGRQCISVVATLAFSVVFWGWFLLACMSRLLNIWEFFLSWFKLLETWNWLWWKYLYNGNQ